MLNLYIVARAVCDNEFTDSHGREMGCVASEELQSPMEPGETYDLKSVRAAARKRLKAKGWKLRPMRCPYCADGRPGDD